LPRLRLLELYADAKKSIAASPLEAVIDALTSLSSKGCEGHEFLLVAFDESRTLLCNVTEDLNIFRLVRRFFRKLGLALAKVQTTQICVMFTDTMSSVANFAQATRADPSLRVVDKIVASKLFPPIYLLDTMDMFPPLKPLTTISDIFSGKNLYVRGRPIWKGYLDKSVEEAFDLACSKVLGGRKGSLENPPRDNQIDSSGLQSDEEQRIQAAETFGDLARDHRPRTH